MGEKTEVTSPYSKEIGPAGTFWEMDGACWRTEQMPHYNPTTGRKWRWKPMNLKAFEKINPEGPMTNFYLPTKEQFAAQGIKDAR